MNDIERITAALLKAHGGLGEATSEQIMAVWFSLDPADRVRYLENIRGDSKRTRDDRSK